MSNDNDRIRNDQNNYGRGTLGVSGKPFRPSGVPGKPDVSHRPPKRHTPKGHDAILAELQERRCQVTIFAGGEELTGRIVGRDKFTIVVEPRDVAQTEPPIKSLVIYKHAIDWFTVPVESLAA
jgi:sRNA-binding regulator protein Hfq